MWQRSKKVKVRPLQSVKKQRVTSGDGSGRLRLFRLFSMVAAYLVLISCYLLTSVWSHISVYEKFSEKFELDIALSNCDLKIVRGKKNHVRIRRWLWKWPTAERRYATGGNLRSLVLRNNAGCHNAPFFQCQYLCSAKLVVNEPPQVLRIIEETSTEERMRIRVGSGVHLNAFFVKGNFDVAIHANTKILGDLDLRSTQGSIRIIDAFFGEGYNAYILASQGSVHILETTNRLQAIDLKYRTVNNKACFSVDTGTDPNNDDDDATQISSVIGDTSSCDPDFAWKHFDTDSNAKITQTEFEDGLIELDRCVGDGCPHYTVPLTLTQSIFDSGRGDGSSHPQLWNLDFTQSLAANNLTELIPRCYNSYSYKRKSLDSALSATNANRTLTIAVNTGEIRLDLAEASYSSSLFNSDRFFDPQPNARNTSLVFTHPDSMLSGIRMLQRDAELMAQSLGKYTKSSRDNRAVYAVFEVSTGVGVPSDRWIYTSNSVFLQLNPAILHILSFACLVPKIVRYKLEFTNGNACRPGALAYNSSAYLKTARRQVYEQIRYSMMERFQTFFKGELVRVKPRNWLVPYRSNFEAYRRIDRSFEPFDYESTSPGHAVKVFYFSFFLALFISLYILVRLLQSMVAVRHHHDTVEKLQERLTSRFLQLAHETDIYETRRESTRFLTTPRSMLNAFFTSSVGLTTNKTEEPSASQANTEHFVLAADIFGQESELREMSKSCRLKMNKRLYILELAEPFLRPIAIIDSVLVTALTRWLVDPMEAFIRMRCVLDDECSDTERPNSVRLDIFMQAHRAFCFQRKLEPVSGRSTLHKELIQKYNLRLQRDAFPYIIGLKWKEQRFYKLQKDERPLFDNDRYFTEAEQIVHPLDTERCEFESSHEGKDSPVIDKLGSAGAEGVLRQFLDEHTEIVTDPLVPRERARIPVSDTGAFMYDGAFAVQVGFVRAFEEWCCLRAGKQHICHHKVPELYDIIRKVCEERAVKVERTATLIVQGVSLHNFQAGGRVGDLPSDFYLHAFLVVWLHTIILFIWPMLLISCAFILQMKYTKLAADVEHEHWLSTYDYGKSMLSKNFLQGTHFVFIAKYFLYTSVAFAAATILRQYVQYIGEGAAIFYPLPQKMRSAIRILCGITALLTLLNCIVFFVMTCLWLLAAAVIDPREYLGYTAAVTTIFSVSSILWSELLLAAKAFRVKFLDNIRQRMLSVLRDIIARGSLRMLPSLGASPATEIGSDEAEIEKMFREAEGAQNDPSSGNDDARLAYYVIASRGQGNVAFDEVLAFVNTLEIADLDEARVDQIFALADKNLDDKLSPEEFETAWSFIKEELADSALNKAGLGRIAIALTISVAILFMLGTFVFIFWVVSAFSENRNLASIVESGLIITFGYGVQRFQTIAPAAEISTDIASSGTEDSASIKKSA